MTSLIVATRNTHKLQEIRSILSDRVSCRSLADFPEAPLVVEDASDFTGNATKKAVALARWLRASFPADPRALAEAAWVLADDSGLEVDALQGAPGVHSARFAALDQTVEGGKAADAGSGNSSDQANNAKLLRLLAAVPTAQRTARFRCVLALAAIAAYGTSSSPLLFEGVCEGRIDVAPRGSGGFGYDPLFIPTGYEQSFAELGKEEKNRLSHRARALAQLRAWLVK